MEKMWAGRFQKPENEQVNDFNSSIRIDSRMYREDILGSIAHAEMLAACKILEEADVVKITEGLRAILSDLEENRIAIDPAAEDIHMWVEAELTGRIGDAGKRLHTARSRNDQVALDTRLYLTGRIDAIKRETCALIETLIGIAEANSDAIMPGYTHLQRAQPIAFSHHVMAYAQMLLRDVERLNDCRKRTAISPLGSAALAGTTYPIDRRTVAAKLGMQGVCRNSIDGVSDRDFVAELAFDLALLMTHLSRFSEEIIAWCSWEFKFIELDDAYATGSSIMPQKKNPDIAELVRGKTGRAYGNLIAVLTMLKGLPLAYNKDMQEDKELIFDSVDTVLQCLPIFRDMVATATVLKENMARAAEKGFINATDCADYLVGKGLPFRTAYKITGRLVADCIASGKTLGQLTMAEWKAADAHFEEDIYDAIDMQNCVGRRTSEGGASFAAVARQIAETKQVLEALR